LWVVAIASQNILPIHIAFIPLLVPPLLYVLTKLQLDRRLIACVMTFGLITPYMFLPVGFGNIFLNQILLANVAKSGVDVSHQCHPRHGPAGAGHGGRPAGGGVCQLSQEARV
jgi:predicted histidine transporter YuiF (NhaC family)